VAGSTVGTSASTSSDRVRHTLNSRRRAVKNDHLYKSVLDSISEGVMTLDRHWRIISWNKAAEQITGFHKEDVLGKECAKIFGMSFCRENCPVERALTCGHPCQDIEVSVRNKKDAVIRLVVNAAPLYDESGVIIGGLETFRDVSRRHWMQEELQNQYGYENMVGISDSMQQVFGLLESLMNTDTTVLIQGESGTGKELVARALHFYGSRKKKAFVAMNCSAIPEGMLESELFGHAKGAFTGAIKSHMGKFQLANSGTLFLDEIGELSPAVQVKLLRVLEDRVFQRLGENTNIRIDIRLVTATNRNLKKMVAEGSFREDLYYRLSVFPVNLPPLRDRLEDIPLLVHHFIEKFNRLMGKKIQGIADGVLETFESYYWPGNIRELANAIEHAFVHAKGVLIHTSDLPQHIVMAPETISNRAVTRGHALNTIERELIVKELRDANWKRSLAAKNLGMSRSTLWRKMEKYGIGK
jgi:PAS domain S-box-containing protein